MYIFWESKTHQQRPVNLVCTSSKNTAVFHYSIFRSKFANFWVLSHCRDAAVSSIPAKTIKPFNPGSSRLVTKFHSDTSSSLSCWRWGRWQRGRRKRSYFLIAKLGILDYWVWCPTRWWSTVKRWRWCYLITWSFSAISSLKESRGTKTISFVTGHINSVRSLFHFLSF